MKKLLLLGGIGLLLSNQTFAQAVAKNPNAAAVEKFDGFQGNFVFSPDGVLKYNINYVMTPKNLSGEAHLFLVSSDPYLLHVSITNAAGKEVLNWKPAQPNIRFYSTWDFSKFESGVYTVHMLNATTKEDVYQFEFSRP